MKKDNGKIQQLVVDNIHKSYKKRPVLRGVSMTVNTGEVVGLLGPNGAGKTTCFYCVTGLIKPNKGKTFIKGQDVSDIPFYIRARMGLGYLPQETSIFRSLNVEDNILSVLELVYDDEKKMKKRLDELLTEFSIKHLKKSPAMALSGGERRRVEIARALAANPTFILFDEPFAGVDPIAVNDIRNLVYHLKDKGIGVFITDHNVRETLDITDRAYVIYDGKVLIEGTKDEIIKNKDVRRVYLGEDFK